MKLSSKGLNYIKHAEGFAPKAYRDASGWSIGYGNFIDSPEEQKYMTQEITEAEATQLLLKNLVRFEQAVEHAVKTPLTQAQFDALVIFAYNVGEHSMSTSTLVKLMNAGDIVGAADQFARWNKSQGKVCQALVARRADEAEIFRGGQVPNYC